MSIPNIYDARGLDRSTPGTPDRVAETLDDVSGDAGFGEDIERLDMGDEPDDDDYDKLLQLARAAEDQSVIFINQHQRERWIRSMKAVKSEHHSGSKYLKEAYRNRSRVFRPKTRSALRKTMTAAANALFSTGDVIALSAVNESDDFHVASAALKQELLNYRLSRVSRRNGVRWFQTCMGALYNAETIGVCISKQTWKYRKEVIPARGGQPERTIVMMDRPGVDLLKPENCFCDFNADWTDPAQTSPYFIIKYQMSPEDAWDMIQGQGGNGAIEWMPDVDIETLRANGGGQDATAAGIRAARNDGRDPSQQASGPFRQIWLREVFMRFEGRDLVFWTLDNLRLLSKPIPTVDAYPAFSGERPIAMGVGALEPFVIYPQSKVDSLQPLQQEVNDQANLRLDHMKQVVAPPAKVLRGKRVDTQQVQRRSPNSYIMLDAMTDLEWANIPDLPQGAFVENNYMNADFDDLAGNFNGSSVQTNRSLNETVGGMRLLAGSADQIGQFDITVFVETWVEPVVWQLLKLEEMYESDATVLAIAGEKAKLFEKFGLDSVTDELLTRECHLTVKVGVGSSSEPQMELQKIIGAFGAASQILMPFIQGGVIKPPVPRTEEIVNVVFGKAGVADGAERFFSFIPDDKDAPQPQAPQPDPAKMAELQLKSKIADQAHQRGMADLQLKAAGVQQKQQTTQATMADHDKDRIAAIQMEHMRSLAAIGQSIQDQLAERRRQFAEHHFGLETQRREHAHAHTTGEAERAARIDAAAKQAEAKMSQMGTTNGGE